MDVGRERVTTNVFNQRSIFVFEQWHHIFLVLRNRLSLFSLIIIVNLIGWQTCCSKIASYSFEILEILSG